MATLLARSSFGALKALYGSLCFGVLLVLAAFSSEASAGPGYDKKGTFQCANGVGSSQNHGLTTLAPNQVYVYELLTNGSSIGSAAALEFTTLTGMSTVSSAVVNGSANGPFASFTPNETYTWVGNTNSNFTIHFTLTAGSSGATFDFVAWCTNSSVSINDVTVAENAGPGIFTVTMPAAQSTGILVDYTMTSGTATAGSDFTAVTGTLTIPAGSTSGTISVPITNDTLVEPSETATITLSNARTSGGSFVTIGDPSGLLTITNDDAATLSVAGGSALESVTARNFTVQLSQAVPTSTVVSYTISNGTATTPADYSATMTGTVTINAGDTQATIPVTVVNDILVESDETVLIAITAPSFANANGSMIIQNDDTTVSVVGTTDAAEPGTDGLFTFSLGATRTSSTLVSYTVGGTAGALDHALVAGSVTIPANTMSVTLAVPVTDDNIVEGTETVSVTITAAPVTIATATDAIDILDDDEAAMSVVGENGSEPTTDGKFTINLSNPRSSETVVTYTVGGTATPDSSANPDYEALSGTATIPAGELSVEVPVVVIDDLIVEDPESVVMTLTAPSELISANPANAQATLMIGDDDVEPADMSRDPDKVVVEEGGKTALITVTLKVAPMENVIVTGTMSNGEATLGAVETTTTTAKRDKSGGTETSSFALTFTPKNWDEPQQMLVTAVDDKIVDGTTKAKVTYVVSSEDARYEGFELDATQVEIRDNDRAIGPAPGVIANHFNHLTYNFMSRRQSLLASHEPKIFRMVNRPEQGASNGFQVSGVDGDIKGTFALSANSVVRKMRQKYGEPSPVADVPLPEETGATWDLWLEGQFAIYDGKHSVDKNNGDFFVGYAGVDYSFSERLRMGVMGELDWMTAKGDTSRVEGTGWMIGPYVTSEPLDNVFFDLRAMWGQSDNTASDTVFGGNYAGDFDTERWLIEAMLSGKYDTGPVTLAPDLRLIYLHEDQDNFQVSNGAGPISVAGKELDLGQLSAGLRLSHEFAEIDRVFEPYLAGRVMWNFENPGLMDTGGNLVSTEDIDAAIMAGFNYRAGDTQISLEGMYSGFLSDNYEAFSAKLMFSKEF